MTKLFRSDEADVEYCGLSADCGGWDGDAAKADADHWLNAGRAAAATGMQRLMQNTAVHALAPTRDTSRFVTFRDAGEVMPGVRPVDLSGHTPRHTGYLLGEGDETVLFWGDTIHSHTVQLRRREVAVATDRDEPGAVAVRRKVLKLGSSNRWRVGTVHL
jgi:glyoxylase-like metal-dependent hydrolase (beta-lactamase superfamily II)